MDKPYEIVTNIAGRKILVIKRYFDIDATEELDIDDFDITYLDVPNMRYNVVRLLLGKTSPLISVKCKLKPRFLTIFNRNDFSSLEPLIDGFSQAPTDDKVTTRAEEILHNIENLHLSHGRENIDTESEFFIGLGRYCLSRGLLHFTSSTVLSMQKGLSAVYSAYVDIHETVACGNTPDDTNLRETVDWLIEEGFIEPVKFVERIHLCPDCHSSMVLLTESCPKCGSSNLQEQDMIHHFRCAHIAPESDYVYGNDLRCPKCKHFLKHIGIDYDRPAKVYTCLACGESQMNSRIKVICSVCGHNTSPQELLPYDIKEYVFTQAGIDFLCNN